VNADELRRLRVRLTATSALVTFVVLALLAAIAVNAERSRRHDELDRHVERTALAADGYAYPQGEPSRLFVDRSPVGFFGPQRLPGAPVVAIDPRGRTVAGPKDALDVEAGRRAYAVAKRTTSGQPRIYTDTTGGDKVRVAVSPIEGNESLLAAVAAVEPYSGADADIRNRTLLIGAVALALWLLTTLVGWLLTGRAMAPVAAVARREEAFLADAAHELRTPVAVIRARAEQALREQGPASTAAPALQAIEQAAERASGTIADMLELARLDARRGRMEREPLRLDFLLEQLAEEYAERAQAAGAQLRLEGELPEAVVEGDERLLARSVANLVENAIRYAAVGGEITIALALDSEFAAITVADRGPGVAPAQRAAIFDRFHRASAAAGGSGLGLPIARLVVEAHDGSLELLDPVAGSPGARFRLRLPLVRATAAG
jgi:two-component system OmpR family sensor kinase